MTTTSEFRIVLPNNSPSRRGEADTIRGAVNCARALCEHYGEATARITNSDGEAWDFHAERLEEVE